MSHKKTLACWRLFWHDISHFYVFVLSDSVRVYDYASKTPLCSSVFNSGATSLLWLPEIVSMPNRDKMLEILSRPAKKS